jgi:hypothetical protein
MEARRPGPRGLGCADCYAFSGNLWRDCPTLAVHHDAPIVSDLGCASFRPAKQLGRMVGPGFLVSEGTVWTARRPLLP